MNKINLDRYKKGTQGLIDFVCLIEQADPSVRDKILSQTAEEDSEFYYRAMKKVVFFEEIIYLEDGIIAEILGSISSKILAYALSNMKEDFKAKIIKLMGFKEIRLLKDEQEKMGDKIQPGLALGAQKQVLKIARGLEQKNKFVFELTDCPRFKSKSKRAA